VVTPLVQANVRGANSTFTSNIVSPLFYGNVQGQTVTITSTATAGTFSGSGASLTNIPISGVSSLQTSLDSKLSRANDQWLTSAEGTSRFSFASGSTTYYRTGYNHEWRNSGDTVLATLSYNGSFMVRGETGSSLHFQNSSGNETWRCSPDGGATPAFLVYNAYGTGVYMNWGATSWSANSDSRKKKNIQPLEYGLAEIAALQPVRFDYVTDEGNASHRLGFIAQDVLPHIPEAVNGSEDSTYGLSTTELIPAMVNATKELRAELTKAMTKIEDLERRLNAT